MKALANCSLHYALINRIDETAALTPLAARGGRHRETEEEHSQLVYFSKVCCLRAANKSQKKLQRELPTSDSPQHRQQLFAEGEKWAQRTIPTSFLPPLPLYLQKTKLKNGELHLAAFLRGFDSRRSLEHSRAEARQLQPGWAALLLRLALVHLLSSVAVAGGLAANLWLSRRGLCVRLPRGLGPLGALGALHARAHSWLLSRVCPSSPWLQQVLLGPLFEELEFRLLLPLLLSRAAGLAGGLADSRAAAAAEAEQQSRKEGGREASLQGSKDEKKWLREGRAKGVCAAFKCTYSPGVVVACSALFAFAHYESFPLSEKNPFQSRRAAAAKCCIRANRWLTALLQGLAWGFGPPLILKGTQHSAAALLSLLLSFLLHALNNLQSAALLQTLQRRRSSKRRAQNPFAFGTLESS
ncbi:hypothetical protein, conserved [Eimeria tenella]|uniref:Uncharacterized protein n=1 Tax=Eimeria tenella TaxID=5802 RepID=U6KQ91_EIMTE|nr:hypothetical protein, conserved [Eimeria tenella]CDJ37608.1 hypothetical protein, conserved [Eimeria tenella]|eukprot:XP_013228446.1 hypothetical protein, conserved [Eimeria tenella]